MATEEIVSGPISIPPQPVTGWAVAPARFAILGVMLSALLSSNLLVTWGIPYDLPYGSFVAKLHPGTYLILLGFLVLLFRQNPFTSLVHIYYRARIPFAFAVLAVVMVIYSVVQYGPSGSAFIIDTLLTPALLALTLDNISPIWRRQMFLALVALLALNAVIGLGEVALHTKVVPYMRGDKPMIEDFFRATALQGHPLSNAVRTLVMLVCSLMFVGRTSLSPLIWLFLVALLPFGSRTGLVMAGVLLAIWAWVRMRGDLAASGFNPRRHLPLVMGSIVGLGVLVGLAFFTPLGSRILSLFYVDESAKARLIVLRVFSMLSSTDLWLGMGPRKIDNLIYLLSRTSSVTDIENIWLVFILQFGLLLTAMFAILLAAFLWWLARGQSLEIKLAVIGFLVFILSNNSLASKSQDMVIFVATVMGASAWLSTQTRLHRAEAYLMLRERLRRTGRMVAEAPA